MNLLALKTQITEACACMILRARMHYGHPDVFDRVFHITRGGISKASRVINISEDIFAGKEVCFDDCKYIVVCKIG